MVPGMVRKIVDESRERGYSRSDQSFEDEVSSVAASRLFGGKNPKSIPIIRKVS